MNFKPFDYQPSMIQHLKDHASGALFVSPGLGKSVCTLRAYVDLMGAGEMKGVLIIAPLRVVTVTWPDQIRQWNFAKHLKVANLRTPEGVEAWKNGTANVFLINYELISGRGSKKGFLDEHAGKDMPVCTLLLDELSLCKSNSKRTKSIVKARKFFKRVHGLTGTPASNGPLDLFWQMRIIDNGVRLGKFVTHMRNKWFISDHMGWKWTPKEGAVEEIQEAIADICHVKLSKDYLSIPEAETVDVDVTLPAKVLKQYKQLERDLVIQLNDTTVEAQSAAVLIGKLMQFTSGVVYDEDKTPVPLHTVKHAALEKILAKHSPVLILTRYITEMDAILKAFPQVVKFDEKLMPEWKAGKIKAFVANPKSISHGLDGLQHSCSTLVWMSLTYSLEEYEQCSARILRTGQGKAATIYRIMAAGSIDWVVASALENKSEGQSTLMASVGMLQRANQDAQQDSKPSSQSHDRPGTWRGLF